MWLPYLLKASVNGVCTANAPKTNNLAGSAPTTRSTGTRRVCTSCPISRRLMPSDPDTDAGAA